MDAEKGHTMWDVFEHILMFISLYVFATSFTLLIHLFVNKWVPPAISSSSYTALANSFSSSLIRGYLAAIIVSYPLFSYLFLRVTKNTFNNPQLRQIRARKTLVYFTLVVTFVISLINVVNIVFNFLGGNVSFNFLLHFAVTFSISVLIFVYYLNQVKEDRRIYE